jgi:threonine/homoserine/homoserine lactone efflux protein
LGVVHLISSGLVYLLVGFGSQSVLRTRPQAAKIVGRISGAAMIVIALGLLAEQALK